MGKGSALYKKKKERIKTPAWYKWLFLLKREEAWVLLKKNISILVNSSLRNYRCSKHYYLDFYPPNHTETWRKEKIFQWLLKLHQPQVERSLQLFELTETLYSHFGQEAKPLHPAEKIRSSRYVVLEAKCSVVDWNVLRGYWNSINRKQSGAHFRAIHQDL